MTQRATNEKLIPTSYCVPHEPIYGESYDFFWLTCLTDLLVFFPVKAINLIGLSHPTPHWPLKPRLKRCARLLDPLKASCKAGFKVAALEMKYDHVKRLPWKPYSIRRTLPPAVDALLLRTRPQGPVYACASIGYTCLRERLATRGQQPLRRGGGQTALASVHASNDSINQSDASTK